MKKERIKQRLSPTRELATAELAGYAGYIETFNHRTRRHSYLSGVSPETFEARANLA